MKSKLVVVADLGRLRAYRLEDSRNFSHPRLQLLEDTETNVTRHLSEEVSDQAGQFRKGPKGPGALEGPSALSDGEQHNIDLERRRRAVKTLAQRISELLGREDVDGWYLAADSRINQQVLDEMPPRDRERIQKNVHTNLSKLGAEEVLKHFCE